MKNELRVINSVIKNKDIGVVMEHSNIDAMFVGYPEVWTYIKEYYFKYRSLPEAETLQEQFYDFDIVDVKGETEFHVDALREEFINQKLEDVTMKLGANVGKIPYDRVLAGAISELMELQTHSAASTDIDAMDFALAEEHYEKVRQRALEMGGTPGIPSGIDFFDSAYTSGLSGGDLVVVLGWTGRGKSLLTTMICCNAYERGFKPMIISLEMKTEKVRDRAYTMLAKGMFRNSDLAVGDVNEDDFREFKKQFAGKGKFPIISHDGNNEVTPAFVQAKINQYKPSIVVIDYAQLTSDNAGSADMTARMRNMSKEYKRLAVANDIPIILISSATPDSASSTNSPPIVEQVAWSKQLSYDADLALAVHKHDELPIIEVVCRKNRNGELFSGFFKADINVGVYREFFKLEDYAQM